MKSWTRTLNLDDAHSLLALAEPGLKQKDWVRDCHKALPHLSVARRREVIRILRDGFLEWTRDNCIADALFLRTYSHSPATAQIDLVHHQWALSHDITLLAVEALVGPALLASDDAIQLEQVEDVVAQHIQTDSAESLRKTRTVLLGAMEGIGTIEARGTGQHRSLRGRRGSPHPVAFTYLVLRELQQRGADGMMSSEVRESSLPVRLTQCTPQHAETCIAWGLKAGLLTDRGDEIGPSA